tara:strand:+ start:5147 stop:5866 length:720 start_codon:yes stop_codon:yes gene_type:complete
MDFLPQVIGGSESEDEPEVNDDTVKLSKNELNEDDVFDNKSVEKLEMKVVKDEPEPEPEPTPPTPRVVEEPVEKPVKKPRKKRVMTDAQKERLALARVKALEVRRANAKKKKEIRDLKKQKADQELDQLRNDVKPKQNIKKEIKEVEEKEPPPPSKYHSPINACGQTAKTPMYSQEDVDLITFKAISNYDEVRKQRKKEKLKKREEDNVKEKERQRLLRIVNPSVPKYDPSSDPFANCY